MNVLQKGQTNTTVILIGVVVIILIVLALWYFFQQPAPEPGVIPEGSPITTPFDDTDDLFESPLFTPAPDDVVSPSPFVSPVVSPLTSPTHLFTPSPLIQ